MHLLGMPRCTAAPDGIENRARRRTALRRHSTFAVCTLGFFFLVIAAADAQMQQMASSHGAAAGCAGRNPVIAVTVTEIRHAGGMVVADLHGDNPEHFLKKGKKLKRIRMPARAGSVRLCIPVDAPGIYTLAVYHDENGNRKFDKNWLGIPVEPFGVSRNPSFLFGPPDFEDSAFKVEESGATLVIALRH